MTSIPSLALSDQKTSTTTSSAGAQKTSMSDYRSFLRLLVAQMKNQDPTSPMDSTAYMTQLATFSQVEQSVETNSKLTSVLSRMSIVESEGLIGRKITSTTSDVSGVVKSVKITSDGAVATLDSGKTVQIGPGITVS